MKVLSIATVFAIVAISGCLGQSCPNSRFLQKHECQGCTTQALAIQKHQQRNKIQYSGRNTVLYGNPGSYHMYTHATLKDNKGNPEIMCRNTQPVGAWKCVDNKKQPAKSYCLAGSDTFYDHSAVNGHLFHNMGTNSFNPLPAMVVTTAAPAQPAVAQPNNG